MAPPPDGVAVQSVKTARAESRVRDTVREIDRADRKAGILFTGAGIVLGIVTSLLVAARPRLSGLPLRFEVTLLFLVTSAALALAALGMASYPRGVHRGMPAGLRSGEGLFAGASERRIRRLSRIAYQKYRCIKLAFVFFAVTLASILVIAAETIVGR